MYSRGGVSRAEALAMPYGELLDACREVERVLSLEAEARKRALAEANRGRK